MGLLAKFGFGDKNEEVDRIDTYGFLGNTGGWVEFASWAYNLDAEEYEKLVHLAQESYVMDTAACEQQLTQALARVHRPDHRRTPGRQRGPGRSQEPWRGRGSVRRR